MQHNHPYIHIRKGSKVFDVHIDEVSKKVETLLMITSGHLNAMPLRMMRIRNTLNLVEKKIGLKPSLFPAFLVREIAKISKELGIDLGGYRGILKVINQMIKEADFKAEMFE